MRTMLSVLFVALLFVFITESRSQVDQFVCATDSTVTDEVGELVATTWTLKILLVEFSNVKHNTNPYYTYTGYENLFFSENIYVSPNMYSPDGEPVYGSMRDYFSIMSDGDFNLTGHVVNLDDGSDGTPDWLTLPLRKGQYDSTGAGTFINHAYAAANTAGLDISTNGTTKLAIIYAGHTYRTFGGLNPRSDGFAWYTMGEKFACCAPYNQERSDAKFSEIGINAHEFGHLLGFPDLYENGTWDLMNGGPTLGPNYRGACPAPLNPETRKKKGWLAFQDITENHTFQADYNLRDPEVFQIKSSTNSGYYWLIETRRFDANMTIGTTSTTDYNYYLLRSNYANPPNQGVVVWRVPSSGSWGSVLHADGKPWTYPPISPGDPFPGSGNVRVLSPWSDSRNPPPYWYPNTKPSTNVGMEIVGEGTGYFTLDLYYSDPFDASPSKPQNPVLSSNSGQYGNIRFSWTTNQETDLASYEVSRKVDLYGNVWEVMVSATTNTYWVDPEYLYAPTGGDFRPTYRVRAKDTQGLYSVYSDEVTVRAEATGKIAVRNEREPETFSLHQNHPNPFNPSTQINYDLPEPGNASLVVYDVLGRKVAELAGGYHEAGYHTATWNASDQASGIYFARLVVTGAAGEVKYSKMTKLVLMK